MISVLKGETPTVERNASDDDERLPVVIPLNLFPEGLISKRLGLPLFPWEPVRCF